MSAMSDLDIVKQEVFAFLDDLRLSGETNMYGAAPYIVEVFGVNKAEARVLLSAWMQTFSERHAA